MQSKKFLSSLHFSKAISIFSESPPEHIGHTFGNRHSVKLRPLALSHVRPYLGLGNLSAPKRGDSLRCAEVHLPDSPAAFCRNTHIFLLKQNRFHNIHCNLKRTVPAYRHVSYFAVKEHTHKLYIFINGYSLEAGANKFKKFSNIHDCLYFFFIIRTCHKPMPISFFITRASFALPFAVISDC